MAQKTHSLGLRAKKRINWNASFCVQNLNNYSEINFKNQQIERTTTTLFSQFHFFPNYITINKNFKNYQIQTRLLKKTNLINMNPSEIQQADRFQFAKNETKKINELFLNNKETKYTFSDFFFNSKSKLFKKMKRTQFLVLTPRLVIHYIMNQMNKNGKLKRSTFQSNLNLGILTFSYQLLKRIQHNIIGIKIMCSGKWKKTQSGRKQKLTIKFGKIVNPSISNLIVYDYGAQKTKFGIFSIKIWIAQKKDD